MQPHPPRHIGVFGNTTKPGLTDSVRSALEVLRHRDAVVTVEHDVAGLLMAAGLSDGWSAATRPEIADTVDLVITFGGDGTMLGAVHDTLAPGTPILGVNLGKLGFLADVPAGEVEQAIGRVLAGSYRVEERMVLAGELDGDAGRRLALNDFVIGKSGVARVITISAWVGGAFLATFIADGIIVATPTGSTAYSLATGGPIVVPSTDVIVISPISAHTLTARPIIVPGDSEIVLCASAAEGDIMSMADGEVLPHPHGEVTLRIRRHERAARLIKDVGPDYFEMLRSKLSWAQDARISQDTHPGHGSFPGSEPA